MRIGKEIIQLFSIDSTNTYMGGLIEKNDTKEGLIVTTVNQTNGKGLNDNRWESETGKNLTFSLLLKPHYIKPEYQFILTKFAALAVFDFISGFNIEDEVSIKWTNDIYVGSKKVAGILINNTITGSCIKYSVIGFGININQTIFKSDAPNPVSVKQLTHKEYSIGDCLQAMIKHLNLRYDQLISNDRTILDNQYVEYLFRINEEYDFIYKGEFIKASIKGVDEYGRLVLLDSSQQMLICNHGEIIFE